FRAWIGEERAIPMRMDVDEPRRDRNAACVNLDRSLLGDASRDTYDSTTGNCNIHLHGGCTCAVEHVAIAYHEVVRGAARQYDRGRAHDGCDRAGCLAQKITTGS